MSAAFLAFYDGTGQGALKLWPLFGTINQLMAALALLLLTVYFARKKKSLWISLPPFVFMVAMTGWAMVVNIKNYYASSNWLLFAIGGIVFVLEVWMIVESALVLRSVLGASEEPAPNA